MISDILTVIWKEAKEYTQQRGSSRGTALMIGVPLLILGIVMPLQFGKAWIQSPVSLIAWAWILSQLIALDLGRQGRRTSPQISCITG